MATRADTRLLVRQAISQTDPSAGDFTDDEINGFIAQGVRYLCALVKKPTKRTSFQVVADTAAYAIATYVPDLIIPLLAYFGNTATSGDVGKIRIIPEEELAEVNPEWLDATSGSQGRPQFLINEGANLVLWPRPNALESATGKKLYLSHVYQPAITDDSAALPVPLLYHDLVKDYAAHLCYMGKLATPAQGLVIKGQVQADAKRLESLITKESESPGLYWGNTIDTSDNENGLVLF